MLSKSFSLSLDEAHARGATEFGPSGDGQYYFRNRKTFGADTENLDSFNRAVFRAETELKAFLDYVHTNYPEIDIDATDSAAWERNASYIDSADSK